MNGRKQDANTRRTSEDDRQRERVRSRRRQNFSEEIRQVEWVRARGRRENYGEKRRQAERDRARMNIQRQREREIQRQRERQQNNDMMTESVVLMPLWPPAINILISNWCRTRKFSQSFKIQAGKTEAFHFFHHSHALITLYDRPIFMLWLVKIWQVRSLQKLIYTASWTLFTFSLTAEADRVFCQLVMFFYCLFPLDA